MSATGIGAAVRRKEDFRFITGKGQYTDDVVRPGETRAVFVRSPHAHAKIKSIDVERGEENAGRGRRAHRRRARHRQDRQSDLRLDDPFQGRLADEDGAASGARRRQGQPCRRCGRGGDRRDAWRRARDAAEKVKVDYEVLPAVADPAKAQAKARRRSTTIAPKNTIYEWHLGDAEGDRGGLRRRQARHQARHRQQPAGAERDRAARGARRIRRRHRSPHAVEYVAEPACRAAGHRRLRRHGAGAQVARDRARRRRRLRLQDLHLSGRGRLPVGRAQGAAGR